MNNSILTEKIKDKAKGIGFDLVGICSAETFKEAYRLLQDRKLSEFVKNDLELLTAPSSHLESARSIISLGISYFSKQDSIDKEGTVLKDDNINCNAQYEQFVSLYARGLDYHKIMHDKMNQLIDFLKTINSEVETVAYSDTGAILDREIAYRAGLGWIGKNNNLINPKYGSYLFLGEIITNIDLEYDEVIGEKCGDCDLCLRNCPAQALKAFHLDPNKCLSYLTQKRGILTEKERKNIGNRLWGCDNCLSVCPYNQNIPSNIHDEFKPILKGDIRKILKFSRDNIPEEWKNSALSWRGLRLLKRNTLINIGNRENKIFIPLLKEELKNPSPILRAYAVWALGQIDNNNTINIIKEHYKIEKNKIVIEEIEDILQKD